ncbi:hypothetical protein [Haloterrigena salina]|uniref:hypothetical protein n=1 Tax=Haloterrigena salina TaxID=504937 RepID=UPI000A40A9EB|nr:hypothetical protein [Haloterrigena salina]
MPLLTWTEMVDELVPYRGVRNHRDDLVEHGSRHRLDALSLTDGCEPVAEEFEEASTEPRPRRTSTPGSTPRSRSRSASRRPATRR